MELNKQKIQINAFNIISSNIENFTKNNKKDEDDYLYKTLNKEKLQKEWDLILIKSFYDRCFLNNTSQLFTKFLKQNNIDIKILNKSNIHLKRIPVINSHKYAWPKLFISDYLPDLLKILKENKNSAPEIIVEKITSDIIVNPQRKKVTLNESTPVKMYKNKINTKI